MLTWSSRPLGVGWTQWTHPEGKVYFRYKVCTLISVHVQCLIHDTQNVYTNSWLYDEDTLHNLEAAVAMLRKRLLKTASLDGDLKGSDLGTPLSLNNIEIGIDIHVAEQDGGVTGWFQKGGVEQLIRGCYYICDMQAREAFWIDHVVTGILWEDPNHNMNITGREHLRG